MRKLALFLLGLSLAGQIGAAPHAFPVPFVARDHTQISFTDLPGTGSIDIYTINGEKVIHLPIAPGEAIKHWPVTNDDGKKVATGVYLYIIKGGSQETTGKLVIIR